MAEHAPGPLALGDGPLFFPVTPFDDRDRVALDVLAEHVAHGVAHGAGAVFAACGTGEQHALAVDEVAGVVRVAVAASGGHVPVLAGAGGPLGHARASARAAADAGAEGLLVLPPYLVQGPQRGVEAYVRAVLDACGLPVVVYHRGTARLAAETLARLLDDPRVVGVKDGAGDLALMQELVLAARRVGRADLLFFNGLPTAELSQLAYRAVGVPLYSSAAFAMAPAVATAFYRAYTTGDDATVQRLLDGFYAPLARLRDEVPGYAVSLVKAGLRLGGTPVGPVRPPLVDPSPAHLERLRAILAAGAALLPQVAGAVR